MSIEHVKAYLEGYDRAFKVIEFGVSSATVALAADALGVAEARIAKSLAFNGQERTILLVTSGDARINNRKFKLQFGIKARMLDAVETERETGHAVGGVCPFALPTFGPAVYLDVSLRRFTTVFPACGSSNSAVEMTPDALFELAQAIAWVDVCSKWSNETDV